MNTKTIGIKEFRANISKYVQKAQKGDVRYIVTNRDRLLFEIKPFKKNVYLESFINELIEGLDHAKKGKVQTHEQILKELTK